MSAEPCPMEHLVEAKHDGRLGARESASLVRHLAACAACRELERTLDEVRARLRAHTGTAVTPLEHQRCRLALLRAAAAPPPPPRASLRPPRAVVAAGACLVIALFLVLGLGRASRLRPGAGVLLAQHLPAVSFHWPPPDSRTETTIQGSAGARFERRTDGPLERVELTEGTLALSVRKLAEGERFVVTTADAEVEVRGTVFQVEAHDGKLVSVSVSEGRVEVRHQGARSFVAPGGTWRPTAAIDPPAAPSAPAAARPVAARPVATKDDASKKFAAAVARLASGDYGEASAQLAAFRKANPGDARAEDAAFLAIVSLQRAGKLTDAKDAARRYLAAYPEGDRRAEAELATR